MVQEHPEPVRQIGLHQQGNGNDKLVEKLHHSHHYKLLRRDAVTVQELLNAAQQLSLSEQIRLASQLMQLVVQEMQLTNTNARPIEDSDDSLIGLFAGSPELATQSEELLTQEPNSTSGFTWKES